METVTVSPKFQVVIPKKIRETLGFRVGDDFQVLVYENRIELIPVKPVQEDRGLLRGIDTAIKRKQNRR
ncbi:MAG: AbrB/MazE/SpoVT family DNA-binding domain-containing protein [Desulfomonile tiedjei]|nr:AbrB/MazE/SpoVT family DNA-binding domain-containing protein [Desulfomonile tiedjei]